MAYSDARYRAALRRARRRYRGGRRITWWQALGLGIIAVVMFSGAGGKIAHAVTGGGATTVSTSSNKAAKAVAFARARIGCPYTWGGTGPCSAGYDCSGLVYAAYLSAGLPPTFPRTSEEQWATLPHVTDPHRGDLVFFAGSDGTTTSPGHVGLVLNPATHTMIEAYSTGYPVRISTYGLPSSAEGDTSPVGFARPVPLAHTTTLDAASSYTPHSWARALLHDGRWPASSCNVAAVTAWEAGEGDWTHGHAGWHNPLNDKLPEPGSVNATADGVQKYTSWGSGLTATLATLGGPDYGQIRSALAAGNSAQAVADAIVASPWAASNYNGTLTAEC